MWGNGTEPLQPNRLLAARGQDGHFIKMHVRCLLATGWLSAAIGGKPLGCCGQEWLASNIRLPFINLEKSLAVLVRQLTCLRLIEKKNKVRGKNTSPPPATYITRYMDLEESCTLQVPVLYYRGWYKAGKRSCPIFRSMMKLILMQKSLCEWALRE